MAGKSIGQLDPLSNIQITGSEEIPVEISAKNYKVTIDQIVSRVAQQSATKQSIGLGLVDNTADMDKPVSSAQAAALAEKASVTHTHNTSDINGLDAQLTSVNAAIVQLSQGLALKADVNHQHAIGNVAGLQSALDGKAALSHQHVITDVTGLQTALTDLQTSLAGKASAVHQHAISDITGLQLSLDSKAEVTHRHNYLDIDGLSTYTQQLVAAAIAAGGGGGGTVVSDVAVGSLDW